MIKKYDENSNYGAILMVDVDYPEEVALKHENIAFLLEKRVTNKVEKLIYTLKDQKRYIVHIVTLKQALNHGLKLKKIHKVIEFEQKDWLKPYILMNNEYRTKAQNEFEKNFFKLMNNSVFGKTMENVRNHRGIKLVTTYEKLCKYVNEPNMMNIKCFSKELLAIEMKKTVVKMHKALYLGLTILDLSKVTMYEFYYDYLKQKHGDDVKSYYTDTDSFIIYVKTDDIYVDINNDVNERFDTSNISKNTNRPITTDVNKKSIKYDER